MTGNYPLYEEDLPTKWRLIKTKAGDRIVYVAYQHEYHNYASERTTGKLLFPAPTSKGELFLAWKYVNDRFGLKIDEEQLSNIPEDEHSGFSSKCEMKGIPDQTSTCSTYQKVLKNDSSCGTQE